MSDYDPPPPPHEPPPPPPEPRSTHTQKPGYYPAPDGSERLRWWNGMEWGDRYTEHHQPASTQYAALKTWQKVAVLALFAAVAIAVMESGVLGN